MHVGLLSRIGYPIPHTLNFFIGSFFGLLRVMMMSHSSICDAVSLFDDFARCHISSACGRLLPAAVLSDDMCAFQGSILCFNGKHQSCSEYAYVEDVASRGDILLRYMC